MPTFEEAMQALRAADAAGNVEDARRLAQIADGMRQKDTGGGMVRQFGRGVNERLADIAEAPATLARQVTAPAARAVANVFRDEDVPMDAPYDRPANIAAETLREFPEGAGEPTTGGERVAREAGQFVGETLPFMALPFGAAAGTTGQVATTAPGAAQRVGQGIVDTMRRAPGRTAAAEGTATVTAGAGGGIAKEAFPDSESAEVYGQLVGGIVPMLPVAGAKAAWWATNKAPLTGALMRWGRRMIPFTESGGMQRASDRVRGIVSDPEETARRMGEDTLAPMSPATRSGEKRLMALERAVLDADSQLDDEYARQTREAVDLLRREIDSIGEGVPAGEARQAVEGRKEYLLSLLDQRTRQAAALAEQRVSRLSPEMRQSESSKILREEIETALGQARQQESRLWSNVPKDTLIGTENTATAYRELVGELPSAQLDDVPDIARRMLDRESNRFIGEENTLNELQGLRSKLLETARTARAAGERNKARIADDLADAVLDDLGARAGSIQGEAGETLRTALDFSRTVAERFRRGSVGRILGSERTGGKSVAPEMTAETSIGAGGTRGSVAAGEIREAAPTDQTEEAIRQYLLNRFERSAVKAGRINKTRAEKFVGENADLLDAFPQLRQDMLEAGSAQDLAERTAQRSQRVAQSLTQRNRSRTAEYLGGDVDEEIDRVFKSDNPARFARELVQLVRKDTSGRALKGLKTAVADHLIRRSSTLDETGAESLSGRQFLGALNDRKFRRAAQKILTGPELNRLDRIGSELIRIERSQGRLPDVGGVVDDAPAKMLEMIVSVLGAQQGRKVAGQMGGGTVQTPGIFAGRARAMLNNITRDKAEEILTRAVQDRELFQTLLMGLRTPTMQRAANRRLNAWLAGAGSDLAEQD